MSPYFRGGLQYISSISYPAEALEKPSAFLFPLSLLSQFYHSGANFKDPATFETAASMSQKTLLRNSTSSDTPNPSLDLGDLSEIVVDLPYSSI
jgi:hypothetical protein